MSTDTTTALLITGDTYPLRRQLARLGAKWNRDRKCWVAPDTDAVHDFAAEHELEVETDDVDPDELKPLSYEERRERRHEKKAAKAERLRERAAKLEAEARQIERELAPYDMQFWTEPIKVGHHSAGRHRRLRDSLRRKMSRKREALQEAEALREKADRLERKAEDNVSLAAMQRRLDEAEAAMRKSQRILDGSQHPLDGPAEGEYREQVERMLAQEQQKAAYWCERIEEAGGVEYGPHNVGAGDHVLTRWGWGEVVRANKKTVTVELGGHVGQTRRPWAEVRDWRAP